MNRSVVIGMDVMYISYFFNIQKLIVFDGQTKYNKEKWTNLAFSLNVYQQGCYDGTVIEKLGGPEKIVIYHRSQKTK